MAATLKRITAKTRVIAFEEDMFVPVWDCEFEQKMTSDSQLITMPSLMGHFAMLGLFEKDFQSIDKSLSLLLGS